MVAVAVELMLLLLGREVLVVVVMGMTRQELRQAQAAPVSSLFNTPLTHQAKQPALFRSQAVPYGYALLV